MVCCLTVVCLVGSLRLVLVGWMRFDCDLCLLDECFVRLDVWLGLFVLVWCDLDFLFCCLVLVFCG